jgi:DNA polymerase III delta subunit
MYLLSDEIIILLSCLNKLVLIPQNNVITRNEVNRSIVGYNLFTILYFFMLKRAVSI